MSRLRAASRRWLEREARCLTRDVRKAGPDRGVLERPRVLYPGESPADAARPGRMLGARSSPADGLPVYCRRLVLVAPRCSTCEVASIRHDHARPYPSRTSWLCFSIGSSNACSYAEARRIVAITLSDALNSLIGDTAAAACARRLGRSFREFDGGRGRTDEARTFIAMVATLRPGRVLCGPEHGSNSKACRNGEEAGAALESFTGPPAMALRIREAVTGGRRRSKSASSLRG